MPDPKFRMMAFIATIIGSSYSAEAAKPASVFACKVVQSMMRPLVNDTDLVADGSPAIQTQYEPSASLMAVASRDETFDRGWVGEKPSDELLKRWIKSNMEQTPSAAACMNGAYGGKVRVIPAEKATDLARSAGIYARQPPVIKISYPVLDRYATKAMVLFFRQDRHEVSGYYLLSVENKKWREIGHKIIPIHLN